MVLLIIVISLIWYRKQINAEKYAAKFKTIHFGVRIFHSFRQSRENDKTSSNTLADSRRTVLVLSE